MKGNPKQNLREKANAHIELGTLLKTERGQKHKAQIEALLQQPTSVEEKIEKIKQIDKERADKAGDKEKKPEQKDQSEKSVIVSAYPLKYRVSTLHAIIKPLITRVSYFEFLYRHLSRILLFNNETEVLKIPLLPPRLKLNPSVRGYIQSRLRPLARRGIEICDKVLLSGWIVLTKREYNLIVVLRQLLEFIVAHTFPSVKHGNRNLVDSMKPTESLFLALHHRSRYLDMVIAAIHKALSRNPDYEEELRSSTEVVKQILFPTRHGLSLHGLIVGLNILKYRRYLSLNELIVEDLGDLVNGVGFACSDNVRESIEEHVQKCRHRLLALDKQREEFKRLKNILDINSSGEVDFTILRDFTQQSAENRGDFTWDKEIADVLKFAARFFHAFGACFHDLMVDFITLNNRQDIRVFSPDLFEKELVDLGRFGERLAALSKTQLAIPKPRYLQLLKTGEGITAAEASALQLIGNGIETLLSLAKKIDWILSSRELKVRVSQEPKPLDSHVFDGRPFALPGEDGVIQSNDFLNNRTVLNSLKLILGVIKLAAVHFQHRHTVELLEQGEKLTELIKTELKVVRRFVKPAAFDEIVKMVL